MSGDRAPKNNKICTEDEIYNYSLDSKINELK